MGRKIHLETCMLPSENVELDYVLDEKRTVFSSVYPFKLFFDRGCRSFDFAPVTVFYGSNGSGKTTLLNIIAEAGGLQRHSAFSGSAFFSDYAAMCELIGEIPPDSHILTSDDVTDYLLNIRTINDGIDARRKELFDEFTDRKFHSHRLSTLEEYDDWKESYDAKRLTQSEFTRRRLMKNVQLRSNGETAMKYYIDRIGENALYLIDEPENSLSVKLQQELAEYIASSARYFGCQFVIATHSPFFLAIPGARIYDLDADPIRVKKWTELENVRAYFDFFQQHESEF